MGALVVLTMGVFSSCKDYDDDIDNHASLIKGLQEQVSALQTAQSKAASDISTADAAIKAAQADATKALNDITAAKTALQNAISEGDKEVAQKALDAANAAAEAAIKAEAAAASAKAEAEAREAAIKNLQDQLNTLSAAIGTKVSQADFDAMIATLATKEGMETALNGIKADVAELNALLASNAKNDEALAATVAAISARLDTEFAKFVKNEDYLAAIAEINARIAAIDLDAVKAELRALIDANTGQIAANKESISLNAAAITALQATVQQIETNKAAIAALDTRVTKLEDAVKAIDKLATKEELGKLATDIKNLETLVAAKATQADINAAVAAAKADIQAIIDGLATKAQVSTLSEELQTVKDQLALIPATLEELQNMTGSFNEKITKLNGITDGLQTQINNLAIKSQDDVDALKSAIFATVETMIAAKTTELEGKIQNLTTIITTNQASNASQLQGLQDAIAGIQASMASYALNADVTKLDGRVLTLENQLADLNAALAEIATELAGLTELEVKARNLGPNAASAATTLASVLKAMNDKIVVVYNVLEDVKTKVDKLGAFASNVLTSIVTKPSEWIYGLPRINANVVDAQKTYTVKVTKNATGALSQTVTESTQSKGYSFTLAANYWLNPFTVDYTKYNYAFEELGTKNTVTRASTLKTNAKPVVNEGDGAISYKNNVLTVQFHFDNPENVNDAITNGDVNAGKDSYAYITTLALRATLKDEAKEFDGPRTVISDYAVVVPSYIKDLKPGNSLWKKADHQMGNQEYHLNNDIRTVQTEDNSGKYSFTIQRDRVKADGEILTYGDTQHGFIDLDRHVDLHFTNAAGNEEVWTNKKAREEGFTFKYTFVDNGNLFNQEGDNNNIVTLTAEGAKVSSAGKAGIVLVEVQANNKTYAYGYVSILITNTTVTAEVELPGLVLNCATPTKGDPSNVFTVAMNWSDVEKALKDKGIDMNVVNNATYYTYVAAIDNLTKYADETGKKLDNKKGTLGKNGTKLEWKFTEAEATATFYKDGKPITDATYETYFRIEPTTAGAANGYQAITVKVTIPSVTFPAGSYSKDSRIQQMWFKEYTASIATSVEERSEVHANVEVLGQVDADDEFIFDISSTFVKNQFTITPATGFTFAQDADVFFNAEKYAIRQGTKTAWPAEGKNTKTCIAYGSSGTEYAMFLTGAYDLTLKAAPKSGSDYDWAKAQDVVVLTGAHNEIATFQGFNDPVNGAFARDLLNHARHDRLAAGQTFTTHMILHQPDNCLDIYETGDRVFDIRYLRPISANVQSVKTVYDAQNDGNKIWLADLVDFVDWRNHAFTASDAMATMNGVSLGKTGITYMKYYGVTTIKADFDQAKTNINGGSLENPSAWPLITDITGKMKFTPDTKAKDAKGYDFATDPWTAAGFKEANGYYLYENNAGGVGDFYIYIPVTIVYSWGETEPDWVLIHVVKTQGQSNTARQK